MFGQRVWLSVLMGVLLAAAPAHARGGGHGGGGHGGGHGGGGHCTGHGGGGHRSSGAHVSGAHPSVHFGGGNHGPRATAGGRIYPWIPPPFVVGGGEFMQCSGQDIAAGADQDTVLRACGPPGSTRQAVYVTHSGEQVVEVWSYQRPNAVTRTLRFENGVLTSIDTVGALNR